MRMKNDEVLPAYNLQVGTENGFVCGVSVHQSGNDASTFIEHMESRIAMGLSNPIRAVGDAGYGNTENYDYLKGRNIEGYLKYRGIDRENSNRKKDRFHWSKFVLDDYGVMRCPTSHVMREMGAPAVVHFDKTHYTCEKCHDCEHHAECVKHEGKNKILRISKRLRNHQKSVRERQGAS